MVLLSGIEIEFPFVPYQQQNDLMKRLIQGLQQVPPRFTQSQNSLIESPTGTGKTLCLLCAILGWREVYMEWRKAIRCSERNLLYLKELHQKVFGPNIHFDIERDKELPYPTIYYASRTHSQLSQSVSEIKNTKYKYDNVNETHSRNSWEQRSIVHK